MSNPKFNIGDPVEWSSQACGRETIKVGTIVAIIPAHSLPGNNYRIHHPPTLGRSTVSYVVEIDRKATKARGTARINSDHYWPIASRLRPRDAEMPVVQTQCTSSLHEPTEQKSEAAACM